MEADHLEETETHRRDRTRIYGPLRTQPTRTAADQLVPLRECCAWCKDRLAKPDA